MNETKTAHTPGKWRMDPYYERDKNVGVKVYPVGSFSPICRVAVRKETIEQDEANARLIAAAPELLKYKQSLESLTPGGSEFVDDPERCAEFVRDRLAMVVQQQKRIQELSKALEVIEVQAIESIPLAIGFTAGELGAIAREAHDALAAAGRG